ncbi:MAG: terminase family protein [Lentisphaerota bacterium]
MAITFSYTAHPAQRLIHHARGKRFRAVCCGRRFGKTRFAAAELLDIGCGRGGLFAWIAPTYFIAERGERALTAIAGEFVQFKGQNPRRAFFKGAGEQSEVLFLSADNPDTILGEGYDGVIVDEAARIEGNVWQQYIRPALADKLGWALFITTPKGRNWFFDMHTRGNDPSETEYASFTFPSNTNPYFPQSEWDEAKRTTPADIFRQEYEAEFLEDSAGVFHHIDRCLLPPPLTSNYSLLTGSSPVIGCDIAKHTDFTVLIAMDRLTGRCFDMDRFNHLDWPIQKERILTFARKHHGRLILDATGAGDPIYDDLIRVYPNIEPFKFTNHSKTELVQRLIVAVEQAKVSWPSTWDVLTNEMKRFEYAISPNGASTYNAPAGFHDD